MELIAALFSLVCLIIFFITAYNISEIKEKSQIAARQNDEVIRLLKIMAEPETKKNETEVSS